MVDQHRRRILQFLLWTCHLRCGRLTAIQSDSPSIGELILMPSIDDVRFNAAYRGLRNRFLRYNASSIVGRTITDLNLTNYHDPQGLTARPPWLLLLLLKWLFLHGEFGRGPDCTDEEYADLLNRVHNLEPLAGLPSPENPPLLFFRALAYQQFWLQEKPNKQSFGRPLILFGSIQASSDIARFFSQRFGLSIGDFLDLSLLTLTRALKHHDIPPGYYRSVRGLSERTVKQYFDATAASPSRIRDSIQRESRPYRSASEFRERTPLVAFPYLKLRGQYYSICRHLLYQSLQDFIYDSLRRDNAQRLMRGFGDLFESYLRRPLCLVQREFSDESELHDLLEAPADGAPGKLVDFCVWEPEGTILIDAKGVGANHIVMTSQDGLRITERLKSSALHGLEQVLGAASRIHASSVPTVRDRRSPQMYGIIVTYKDLYLPRADHLIDFVGEQWWEDRVGMRVTDWPVPPTNIFFVSIADFEEMCQASAQHNRTLADLIRVAIARSANQATSGFRFAQHLRKEFGTATIPRYLTTAFDERLGALAERIRAGES